MARYAAYPTTAPPPVTNKWLMRALILSLLLHAGFFLFAYWKKLDIGFTQVDELAPPKFVMHQVTIDPKLLEPPDEAHMTMQEQKPTVTALEVPMEKPEPKELQLKPNISEVQSPLLEERPESKPINFDQLVKSDAISAGTNEKQIGAIASALLKDSVRAPNQPIVRLPNPTRNGDGVTGTEGIPGRQSLDDALAMAGPLPAGDRPIAMQGGALFDYDSADLRADAMDEMQKLGEIVRRNPRATFRIEGHTDSIGSHAYNLALSERRAESVKQWLVANLNISAARIETVGFGNEKWIVPPDRSVEEQQPNRRVEIVIKTNR